VQSNELAQTLGQQLHHHRQANGLSLAELAQLADVSKSILSLIERGEANPSIETLWRIAQALRVPLGALLAEPEQAVARAIPKESGAPTRGESGMQAWLIAASTDARRSELHDLALPPGTTHGGDGHTAGTTEVIVCIHDTVSCGPEGDEVRLGPGDAAWFRADRPHRYIAGNKGARLINLVLSP
jgi:transcriptional regulator with XRE-family HTH domain